MQTSSPSTDDQVEGAAPVEHDLVDDPDLDPDTYDWSAPPLVADPDPGRRHPDQWPGDGAPWRAGL